MDTVSKNYRMKVDEVVFFFVRLFVIEFWEHCREGRGCIEFDTRGKNIGIVFGNPFRTRVCLRSLR